MQAFLIVRFVFFCNILFYNTFTLIFASWNVGETMASSGIWDATAVMIIVISGGVLLMLGLTCADEFWIPVHLSLGTAFECSWTFVFALLQIGGAITATALGPPVLCSDHQFSNAACTSISLVVPLGWFSSMSLLGYAGTLIVVAWHHRQTSRMWSSKVSAVEWFKPAPSTRPASTIDLEAAAEEIHIDLVDLPKAQLRPKRIDDTDTPSHLGEPLYSRDPSPSHDEPFIVKRGSVAGRGPKLNKSFALSQPMGSMTEQAGFTDVPLSSPPPVRKIKPFHEIRRLSRKPQTVHVPPDSPSNSPQQPVPLRQI